MTASSQPQRRHPVGRLTAGIAALAAFVFGVPALLWSAGDGGLLPDPGAGGWEEVRAQLASGLLPEGAVLAAAIPLGWLVWGYLMAMIVTEIVAAWRERGRDDERAEHLSGVRRLVARLLAWAFAGQSMVASLLVVHQSSLPVTAQVAVVDGLGTTDSQPAGMPVPDPAGFERDAYVGFGTAPSADTADPATTIDGASSDREVLERVIVPGDCLWDIAVEMTGDGMNWPAIWSATDLGAQRPPVDPRNPDLIFPGNVVRIPVALIPAPVLDQLRGASPVDAPTKATEAAVLADPGPMGASPTTAPPAPSATTTSVTSAEAAPTTAPPASRRPDLAQDAGVAPVALIIGGLGAAGSMVILAGVARRRHRAMAASRGGQRPPRQAKRTGRTSRRLSAAVPDTMWSPEDLAASWNSLRPSDPGSRQPWCVRWNSAQRVLECAWTPDPGSAADGPAAPPQPGPDSPWRLVEKQDRSGRSVEIWTITEADVPGRPARDVVPAMVGCADGRRGTPGRDGFFINLEAAGIVSVESSRPDLIDPEGVVRALLLQLVANGSVDVHLLNTDLGLADLEAAAIHTDPMALEGAVVAELAGRQELWDDVSSMFVARAADRYSGPLTLVAGPAGDLQSCSHLLSLARAGNVPLVVLALGPLAHAWASFHLEPEPDKHTIRFPSARAVLSFDHLSWASPTESADLIDLINESSRAWIDRPEPVRPVTAPDSHIITWDPDHLPWEQGPPSSARFVSRPDSIEPMELDLGFEEPVSAARPGSSEPSGWDDAADAPPPSSGGESSVGVDQPARDGHTGSRGEGLDDPEVADALWDMLPEADPTTLADPSGESALDDIDWAVVGDDAELEQLLDTTLDELLSGGPGNEADEPGDAGGEEGADGDELIVTSPWDAADSEEPIGAGAVSTASGRAAGSTPTSACGRSAPTARLSRVVPTPRDEAAPDQVRSGDGHLPTAEPTDDATFIGAAGPATTAGLRLELCGPIRLLKVDEGGLMDVPISSAGITPAQLALLAYLVVAARPGGGVGREQIALEFWSEEHGDGTSRVVRPATVKRRMVELRGRLAKLAEGNDGKVVMPEAVDGRYGLRLANDWHELRSALLRAESFEVGSDAWAAAVDTIVATVRPPGLLTPPGGARQLRHFAWIDDHYHSLVQDLTRRVLVVLAEQAQLDRVEGRYSNALDVLGLARSIAPMYPREIADGLVATYLALGDPVRAEQECEAYERQFDEAFLAKERMDPQPGNPRVRLNDYLNHRVSDG